MYSLENAVDVEEKYKETLPEIDKRFVLSHNNILHKPNNRYNIYSPKKIKNVNLRKEYESNKLNLEPVKKDNINKSIPDLLTQTKAERLST